MKTSKEILDKILEFKKTHSESRVLDYILDILDDIQSDGRLDIFSELLTIINIEEFEITELLMFLVMSKEYKNEFGFKIPGIEDRENVNGRELFYNKVKKMLDETRPDETEAILRDLE